MRPGHRGSGRRTAIVAKKKTKRKAAPKSNASKPSSLSRRGKEKAFPRPRESADKRRARAARILEGLESMHPHAAIALEFADPLELLVATMLSAQCTDERVNQVTQSLFKKYRSARAYAEADPATFEREIHATGFFRQKTRSIQAACGQIVERHGGRVPDTMAELVALEGVARKTANVLLGQAFGKNEGIVVDTHVGRVAMRLALAPSARDDKDAVKIERDLMAAIPRDRWTRFGDMAVWHGRLVCTARKPDCAHCKLAPHCPSALKA